MGFALLFTDIPIKPVSNMNIESFSMFSPVIKEVIVVAILLPKRIPILLLKLNVFAFIRLIVKIIIAELDWIKMVVKKPSAMLLAVVDVNDKSLLFILLTEREDKHSVMVLIENMNKTIPPINKCKNIISPLNYI